MKQVGTTRKGDPFIRLVLADKSGEIEGKVWDRAQVLAPLFHEGDILEIEGSAGSYRGQLQVTVSDLQTVQGEVDPTLFLEEAERDPAEMMADLRELMKALENPSLRRLVDRFLSDRQFVVAFQKAPAAKNFHHNYVGGLLEHTLSVCRLAVWVADHYPQLDRDLLIVAAFLHDVGKTRELSVTPSIAYTDEGRLLGHLVLGSAMLDEKLKEIRGFPPDLALRLRHMILSHHGEYAFGSPKRPKFLEAFALHLIDDLDAKINGLGRFMEKDQQEGAWTDYNRLFERYLLKGALGHLDDPPLPRRHTDKGQVSLFHQNDDDGGADPER
jgi:3'-5' exoribonuclease